MKKTLMFALRVALALPFIVFGLNKFLLFADMPPPTDPIAQQFLGAMFGSYLAKLVGAIEIVAGLLLVIPRTTFFGALLLLPININIIAFHLAHDNPGNGIWVITTLLHLAVLFTLGREFKALLAIGIKDIEHSQVHGNLAQAG
jgi:putative oxidoreductase